MEIDSFVGPQALMEYYAKLAVQASKAKEQAKDPIHYRLYEWAERKLLDKQEAAQQDMMKVIDA